jgi:hypothetical protein
VLSVLSDCLYPYFPRNYVAASLIVDMATYTVQ